MFHRHRLVAALVVVAFAASCEAYDDGADTVTPVTPVPTLAGVGAVPAKPSAVREPVVVVRPPVNADGTDAQLAGEAVEGNRILMIGDSILASTSSRYGNHMCEAVVPLGWAVAVEAEPSRFIDFGNRVLDRLLGDGAADADWDAAVVFLGSNYGGDAPAYAAELTEILDRLAPRPVLLFTVTEYRPNYVDVNEIVNRLGVERDNVTVLDWKTISEAPGVLSSDRLHPTDAGRRVLAESVAAALGRVDGVGECLRSTFRNDSAIGGDSTTVLGRPASGAAESESGRSGSGSTTTTTGRPGSVTTTTVSTGGGGGASTTVSVTPSTTLPASTSPASTAAPTTAPVTTAPATTSAPTNGGEGAGGAEALPVASPAP